MPTYTPMDTRLPVKVPRELAEQLAAIARVEGESRSSIVRRALRRLVAEHEADQRERETEP